MELSEEMCYYQKKVIQEFKEIYKEEYGEKISDQRVQEIREGLIELFKVTYWPKPKSNKQNQKTG